MDKLSILFRTLSISSFGMTLYGLMQNKSIDEIVEQLEKEQSKNKLINDKYQKLLENK
jgi:predicted sugar kinase